MKQLAAGILLLAGCSLPLSAPAPMGAANHGFRLMLPPRMEGWRETLDSDLETLTVRFREGANARWPIEDGGKEREIPARPLTLRVASGPEEAAGVAAEWGLGGDPAVPRTHPAERLALMPLPRDEVLLAELVEPPWTFRRTLRHEAAHLLSLDRPGLRAAPSWFQEGFAEAWTDLSGGAPIRPDLWPGLEGVSLSRVKGDKPFLQELGGQAAEVRLDGWRLLAVAALGEDPGPNPWKSVEDWTAAQVDQAWFPQTFFHGEPSLFGRDLAFGLDEEGRPWLVLAALPGRTTVVKIPLDLGSGPFTLEARVGRTGAGNAGLDLPGKPGARILFDRLGGVSAFLQGQTPPAPTGRMPGTEQLGKIQSLVLKRSLQGGLMVLHGGTTHEIPGAPLGKGHGTERFWVRDGALKIVLPAGHPVPAGFSRQGTPNEIDSHP